MSQSPLATPLPWNLVSGAYAAEVTPAFEAYAADAWALAAPPADGPVLDTACGPGTLTLLLRRTGRPVAALDFSPSMVALLRSRLADEPGPAVDLREGDGQALPWADATFDAAFSMFGLIFYPDRLRGLRELRRVTRPGGAVVVSSWHPMEGIPAFQVLFGALRALLPDLPPGAPGALGTEPAIREEFAAAGFTEVGVHTVTHGLCAPDAAAWFDGMERTLAPLVLLRHHMGDAWAPVRDALRTRVITGMGEGPVDVRMPAWITVARG